MQLIPKKQSTTDRKKTKTAGTWEKKENRDYADHCAFKDQLESLVVARIPVIQTSEKNASLGNLCA